jgi:hypothetical protein
MSKKSIICMTYAVFKYPFDYYFVELCVTGEVCDIK